MMTVEVPLVAAFGVLYLGEPAGWRLILGALLIFGSAIGLSLVPAGPAGGLKEGELESVEAGRLERWRVKGVRL